ncbi:MAG TPA: transposase [Terriglobales bacterium]|nr:transposase [Terriglobales bacterium]
MTRGLVRFHQSGQSHFLTFSCYRRQPNFSSPKLYELFLITLEAMRQEFDLHVFGYVVMPEHVHLLLSEPKRQTLADAIHWLKQLFARRAQSLRLVVESGHFWQRRYYDRNVRAPREFEAKLVYMHNNPVKRGLVKQAHQWTWSSCRHYLFREIGPVEIESEWTARERERKITGGPERVFLSPTD